MKDFLFRIKFASLWLLAGTAFVVYRTIAVRQNAYNASLLTAEEFRNYSLVFVLFAILALALKGKLHRKTNIIAGICVGIVQIIVFTDGFTSYPSEAFNIITVLSILIMASLVYLSYKLPEEEMAK